MNTIKLNTIGERPIKKGGASGGGGGNYVYYSGEGDDFRGALIAASVVKVATDSGIIYWPMGMALYPNILNSEANILSAGFDLSMKISISEPGKLATVGESIAELSKNWTQITEEEFYNVELPMRIDFGYVTSPYNGNTVGIVNFEYDEGMTWREWVNSDYNTLEEVGFPVSVYEDGNNISGGYESAMAWWVCTPDGVSVRTDDIIEGKLYQMLYAG